MNKSSLSSHTQCEFCKVVSLFWINKLFQTSFGFTAKPSRTYSVPVCIPFFSHTCTTSLTISILHHSGTCVIINKLTLIHNYHPKSIVYIRAHRMCSHSVVWDTWIMTCIYHYSINWSSSTTQKILYALPINPSTLPKSWLPPLFFTVSVVLPFSKCHIIEVI